MKKHLQLDNDRFFRGARRVASDLVDQSIILACPPSIALAGIERYFRAHGNMLYFTTRRMAVEYELRPNRSAIGRHYDRIELAWSFPHATLPSFRGRFTIRPSGIETVLVLRGYHEPDQLTQQDQIAQGVGGVLLQELKAFLEHEFALLRKQQPPSV